MVSAGSLSPTVPEVFLPIRQCVEIIGSGLQPDVASGIIKQCLKGMQHKVRAAQPSHAAFVDP